MTHCEEREEACMPTNDGLWSNNQAEHQEDGQMMLPMKNNSLDCPVGFKHLRRKTVNSSTPSNDSPTSWKSVNYPLNFKRSSFSGFSEKKGNSSALSVVSLKSENSMGHPNNFKQLSYSGVGQEMGNPSAQSVVSLKSENSIGHINNFKQFSLSGVGQKRGNPSAQSTVSLKSENSMEHPNNFKQSSFSGVGQKMGNPSAQSTVSLKSENSMGHPYNFKQSSFSDVGQKMGNPSAQSVVSLKSENSMGHPYNFKQSSFLGFDTGIKKKNRVYSDIPSVFQRLKRETLSFIWRELKRFHRMLTPSCPKRPWRHDEDEDVLICEEEEKIFSAEEEESINFFREYLKMMKHSDLADTLCPGNSIMSPSKDKEKSHMAIFSENDHHPLRAESNKLGPLNRTNQLAKMESMFKNLEENIVTFVENELKHFQKLLSPEHFNPQALDEVVGTWEEEEQKNITKEAFMRMILEFLRRMKHEELAFALCNKLVVTKCQCKLKSNLKTRLAYVFKGIAQEGHLTLLDEIYTELYITEGPPSSVNTHHEMKRIEKAVRKPARSLRSIKCEDIFKSITESDKPVRTVMTEGVAGIGKTVLTQKVALDWAQGKIYQHIQFVFSFSFRGLNLVKEKQLSLVELIHLFFPEIKEAEICSFEQFRVLFIFDGLDECRFPLNMKTKEVMTNDTQPTSLEVLLGNLIKGKLLPSAQIWITTRPAAADQIPPEFVDLVTEVRGFNNPQKEEYFRKQFKSEEESKLIISHIKTSRSLFIMCHIPVFCWIIATVLEDAIKTREETDLPNSLTEMYILFLLVLSKVRNVKYDKSSYNDPFQSAETRKMIQSLGKLAFEQLMKGNLFFYESDLTESGIDVGAASVYSGVLTKIFKEERGFCQQNIFCFVHLSIQEFLAALHVHLTFINTGVNLLAEKTSDTCTSTISKEHFEHFYQNAVDKAVKTQNGKLDLFLRFLLGLSLETNQRVLQGFVTVIETPRSVIENVTQYIKKNIEEILCPLDKANLFHCLNELKDNSLMKEIEQTLKSRKLETEHLSGAQWAALFNSLLSLEDYQESFDLRKYFVLEKTQERFIPLILTSSKIVLSGCFLTEMSYTTLKNVDSYECSMLRDLDLSNNDIQESGLKLLCEGLSGSRLEILRLSGCLITWEGCALLASALKSNPSYLKELDLSYNHPEEGEELLSVLLEDPKWALETLRVEPSGLQFLKPGFSKYAVKLVLDPITAHRDLKISECNRKVTVGQAEKLLCSDHSERFDAVEQLLCKDSLTSRRYWEVEWRGCVSIGATYKGIPRTGESNDCSLGTNNQSWTLLCSEDSFSVLHNNKTTKIYEDPSNKVGVYLDWPGGTISFFRVSSDKVTFLHSFNTKFSEPVYPAFRVGPDPVNSSLTLC